MNRRRFFVYSAELLFIFSFVVLAFSQQDYSLKELVEKNIKASGGKEKILQIKNFSFKAGQQTYNISSDCRMKITFGRDPVITEVILVDRENVKRNILNEITEFKDLSRDSYQGLTMLYSGLFTLMKFENKLKFQGKKSLGPKKFYILTTQVGDLMVDLYLDPDEFTIRRMAFQGIDPGRGKYEVNHDFGPFKKIEDIKIPSSWFNSQLSTRGDLYEISDVKMNQSLEKEFFSKYDVNAGVVEIGQGSLKGNVVDFKSTSGNGIIISTNLRKDNMQKAGFKANEKLILKIDAEQIEIDFFDFQPPRSAMAPGTKLIFPGPRGTGFIIQILSSEYKDLIKELKLLLPIKVRRK